MVWLLLPLAWAYGALIAVRAAAYQRGWLATWRAPVPVWVVGNVVAGGAGKTPTTVALVQHLQSRGIAVGVVSRGWGRKNARTDACHEVMASDAPERSGDEPLLIRRATGAPVFVARNRPLAVRALLAAYPATQIVLCDDGLQHLALERDLEIVVFDERGAGNGWLLPAGPLREPWPRRLGNLRRDSPREVAAGVSPPITSLVLHTGSEPAFPGGFRAQRRLTDYAVASDGSRVPLATLQGKPLHALAGIARPEAFFAMLRAAGLTLERTESLPDHYDFDSYTAPFHAGPALICTEKDAVKLWRKAPKALAVPLVLELGADFIAAVDAAADQALRAEANSATITP